MVRGKSTNKFFFLTCSKNKTQFKVKQWNFRELSGSKPRLTVAVDHDGRPATRSRDRIEKK